MSAYGRFWRRFLNVTFEAEVSLAQRRFYSKKWSFLTETPSQVSLTYSPAAFY